MTCHRQAVLVAIRFKLSPVSARTTSPRPLYVSISFIRKLLEHLSGPPTLKWEPVHRSSLKRLRCW